MILIIWKKMDVKRYLILGVEEAILPTSPSFSLRDPELLKGLSLVPSPASLKATVTSVYHFPFTSSHIGISQFPIPNYLSGGYSFTSQPLNQFIAPPPPLPLLLRICVLFFCCAICSCLVDPGRPAESWSTNQTGTSRRQEP